jgi:hypothetical protein
MHRSMLSLTVFRAAVHQVGWYACRTMAKAKRRKLRARRSKANHGRKPNAGRG